MSIFEQMLLAGLIVAGLVNMTNPRGLLWLFAGLCDYAATSIYYAYGLPLHPFVTALTDALVCLLIYATCWRFGGHRWELPVFTAFQLSVLFSILKLAEIPSDYSYAVLLEAANWLVILIIGGAGTMGLADVVVDKMGGGWHHYRRLHRFVSALYKPAEVHTLWFVPQIKAIER